MKFPSFLKKLDKRLTYLVASILLLGVPFILIRGYLATPPFLFHLKDAIEQDSSVMNVIGPSKGYSVRYSKQDLPEGDTAQFSVQIIGRCDSAYVVVKGFYCKKGQTLTYRIQDTTLVNKCR